MTVTTFAKETYENAQGKIVTLEEEVQKIVKNAQEEGMKHFDEWKSHLDSWMTQFNWKEMVDKIKQTDWLNQTVTYRHELLEMLGIASKEDINNLVEKIEAMAEQLDKNIRDTIALKKKFESMKKKSD